MQKKLTLKNAPLGTKAPAIMGGYWIKVELGWKWFCGSTFPKPGGDWTGELIAPELCNHDNPDDCVPECFDWDNERYSDKCNEITP